MDVVLNSQQLSVHEMEKYDFSGHLFVFFHQAHMASTSGLTWDPLTRLLLFLFLFRLSHIPNYVGKYSQSLSLEGAGNLIFFLRAAVEGAFAPFLLGIAIFAQIWQAPYHSTSNLAQVLDGNSSLPFPREFQFWIHSESLLMVGDLSVALLAAVLSTVAYPSQVSV
jgi:hypothetical protein